MPTKQGDRVNLCGDSIVTGEKAVGAATVQLTATSTLCTRVWVGAPTANHSGGVNTGNILVGGADGQVMTIETTNYLGFFIPVSDASLIWFKGFNAGDVVPYAIFA